MVLILNILWINWWNKIIGVVDVLFICGSFFLLILGFLCICMFFNVILYNYYNYFEIFFIIKKNVFINKLKVGKGSDLKKVMKCKIFWICKVNNFFIVSVIYFFIIKL